MVSRILVSIGSGNSLVHDGPLAIAWITAELLSVKSWTLQLKAIALEMLITWWRHQNGNIFRVTGHLCGEFTGDRWIPCTNGQWRGALMFSLIYVWINGWVNNHEAGDLRCHHAHYDITVMKNNHYNTFEHHMYKTEVMSPLGQWVKIHTGLFVVVQLKIRQYMVG